MYLEVPDGERLWRLLLESVLLRFIHDRSLKEEQTKRGDRGGSEEMTLCLLIKYVSRAVPRISWEQFSAATARVVSCVGMR